MQPLGQLVIANLVSSNNDFNYQKINKKDIVLLVVQYTNYVLHKFKKRTQGAFFDHYGYYCCAAIAMLYRDDMC